MGLTPVFHEPDEFKEMVDSVRKIESALGGVPVVQRKARPTRCVIGAHYLCTEILQKEKF